MRHCGSETAGRQCNAGATEHDQLSRATFTNSGRCDVKMSYTQQRGNVWGMSKSV